MVPEPSLSISLIIFLISSFLGSNPSARIATFSSFASMVPGSNVFDWRTFQHFDRPRRFNTFDWPTFPTLRLTKGSKNKLVDQSSNILTNRPSDTLLTGQSSNDRTIAIPNSFASVSPDSNIWNNINWSDKRRKEQSHSRHLPRENSLLVPTFWFERKVDRTKKNDGKNRIFKNSLASILAVSGFQHFD